MAKPLSAVPNIFATATTTIPLSQLDADFSSIINNLNNLILYSNYVADTGTANAIVLNYAAGITTTSLSAGLLLQFKANTSNTGATTVTVQVNSSTIGSSTIKDVDGSDLTGNEILSGGVYSILYDGSNFRLIGGGGSGGASAGGAVYENTQEILSNYTMTTNKNGMSVGPIQIDSGVTVTIPSGSRWVVL